MGREWVEPESYEQFLKRAVLPRMGTCTSMSRGSLTQMSRTSMGYGSPDSRTSDSRRSPGALNFYQKTPRGDDRPFPSSLVSDMFSRWPNSIAPHIPPGGKG